MDGIRISKTVNNVETKYYLENSNIIYEQRENNLIYYLYDLTGLIGLKYNDNIYYYIKNLQGDIIGILDSSYNQIVTYEYDSWGKVLSIKDNQGNEITDTTNIGIINPFRYREYYYDSETELYYLNSRYYNPEWGRFINADGIIGADKNILSDNLYIYSGNNPVMNVDPTGKGFFTALFVTLVAAVVAKAVVSATSKTYLTATKKDLSNDMFQKSMHGPSGNVSHPIQKKIENKTKNTEQIQDTIQSCINQSNGKNFTSSECKGSVEFTEGDLYYSIQKADYKMSGIKIDNSTWNINVNLSDTYNFTEFRTGLTMGALANNLGFVMQHTGLLVPYYWDVEYDMTYTEK